MTREAPLPEREGFAAREKCFSYLPQEGLLNVLPLNGAKGVYPMKVSRNFAFGDGTMVTAVVSAAIKTV